MPTKSHIHERCGTLKKTSFCTRGYGEIHIQKPFSNNKKGIWDFLVFKIQALAHALVRALHIDIFLFEKYQDLKLWWYFKVPQANCFLANFGKF
jgi:hypothetical protein